jgi:hypothetical protein
MRLKKKVLAKGAGERTLQAPGLGKSRDEILNLPKGADDVHFRGSLPRHCPDSTSRRGRPLCGGLRETGEAFPVRSPGLLRHQGETTVEMGFCKLRRFFPPVQFQRPGVVPEGPPSGTWI